MADQAYGEPEERWDDLGGRLPLRAGYATSTCKSSWGREAAQRWIAEHGCYPQQQERRCLHEPA